MKKYLLAASALAIGVAMSSVALADSTADNNDSNTGSAIGNSLLSGNTVQDNSDNSTDDNSQINGNNLLSGNSDDDTVGDVLSNNQDNDQDNDQVNGNSLLSGNSDDDNVAIGSFNGNGDTDSSQDNDQDNDTYTTTEVDVEVDVEIDASTTYEDSAVSSQVLNASVTGATFEDAGLQLTDDQGDLTTGDVHQENDAFRGFTGIATIAMDTSIGSVNQAATNVTAGSDISFGD